MGRWSEDELLALTTGRQDVVWALERIAVWRELFADAARILLKLAEAENDEHIDNNATASLLVFSPQARVRSRQRRRHRTNAFRSPKKRWSTSPRSAAWLRYVPAPTPYRRVTSPVLSERNIRA